MPMIDWVSALVPCTHRAPLHGDSVLVITRDGEVKREHRQRLPVVGSYDDRIMVRTGAGRLEDGHFSQIELSGNPVKWFQGHNLWGSDDLVGLVKAIMERLVSILDLCPTDEDKYCWNLGIYRLTRVDVTDMFETGSRVNARAWLRQAQSMATMGHHRGAIMTGGTLYFGKHSRRWSLKVYSKGDEVLAKGHEIPHQVMHRDRLLAYADDKLRFELVMRSMELRHRGWWQASHWGATLDSERETLAPQVFGQHLEKLSLSEQVRLPDDVLEGLPGSLRMAYESWRAGVDLRGVVSKATFYRYRNQLLPHGIDLATRVAPDQSNVIPLVRFIEAKPAAVPEWAVGTALLFEPRRRA